MFRIIVKHRIFYVYQGGRIRPNQAMWRVQSARLCITHWESPCRDGGHWWAAWGEGGCGEASIDACWKAWPSVTLGVRAATESEGSTCPCQSVFLRKQQMTCPLVEFAAHQTDPRVREQLLTCLLRRRLLRSFFASWSCLPRRRLLGSFFASWLAPPRFLSCHILTLLVVTIPLDLGQYRSKQFLLESHDVRPLGTHGTR